MPALKLATAHESQMIAHSDSIEPPCYRYDVVEIRLVQSRRTGTIEHGRMHDKLDVSLVSHAHEKIRDAISRMKILSQYLDKADVAMALDKISQLRPIANTQTSFFSSAHA